MRKKGRMESGKGKKGKEVPVEGRVGKAGERGREREERIHEGRRERLKEERNMRQQ